jgi:hypothetical protein
MNTFDDLTAELRGLPAITAPPEIAATVLARIARIEPVPQPKPLTGIARVGAAVADALSWLLLGASAATLTVALFAAINSVVMAKQFSGILEPAELISLLVPVTSTMVMCLLFYLVGLFLPIARMPLNSERRPGVQGSKGT